MSCIIRREQPTTDETPPWQGISFFYAVGSDLLADQLKSAYPDYSTHRQRKHKATIQFLLNELEEMSLRDEQNYPEVCNKINASPQSDSRDFHDQLSAASTLQDSSSCTSPTIHDSPSSLADRSRLHIGQITSPVPQSTTPATRTTAQTFIFSAIDGRTLQPKTKRKMTNEERVLYKKTRKRGACTKCKRQKGRCTHGDDAEGTDFEQVAKRRSSTTQEQYPPESAKLRKIEELPTVRHQSPDLPQAANRNTGPRPNYHEGSSATANLPNSLVTEASSQQDRQWNDRMGREGDSEQLYVLQSHQEPLRNQSPGSQWSLPGDGFGHYVGNSSSPTRNFHSPFSASVGYNEFSFSPEYDQWLRLQSQPTENPDPS